MRALAVSKMGEGMEVCRYTGKPLNKCACKDGCKTAKITTLEWVQPIMKGYEMACCDCGLVHRMDFRIYKGNIQFRAARGEVATKRLRKLMKVTIKDIPVRVKP